jgi:aryl-alcohol dehydrogenase
MRTVTIEDPRPNEVLVRIVGTGICQTDAHIRNQDYSTPLPVISGHDGAGVAESVGSAVDDVAPEELHLRISIRASRPIRARGAP